jgi:hypothetical protein
MSQRLAVAARRRRRLITYAWVSAMALVVILLIYKEQTALLYILATLGITALLAVVAFADLRGSDGLVSEGEAPASSISAGVQSEANAASARSTTRRRR